MGRRIWLGNFRQTRAIRARAHRVMSRGKIFENFFACEARAAKRLGNLRERDNRVIARDELNFSHTL
jgi:hypothetical protein